MNVTFRVVFQHSITDLAAFTAAYHEQQAQSKDKNQCADKSMRLHQSLDESFYGCDVTQISSENSCRHIYGPSRDALGAKVSWNFQINYEGEGVTCH